MSKPPEKPTLEAFVAAAIRREVSAQIISNDGEYEAGFMEERPGGRLWVEGVLTFEKLAEVALEARKVWHRRTSW